MESFKGKKILVGISGGIAAYKVVEIIRELVKSGVECRVVLTEAAQKFVTPLTLATITQSPVLSELFPSEIKYTVAHIEAARWPDVILLCPATANIIGKIANGIADNLLTTIIMATRAPVLVCPAMNTQMYLNPIVQANIQRLVQLNYHLISPSTGELACQEQGVGRLAEKSDIFHALEQVLRKQQDFRNKNILITAGRTEESWDPVRIFTNRASGKMGFALATTAIARGATVTLISGPSVLTPPSAAKFVPVTTAQEMATAVETEWPHHDILIMSAAVADFRPKKISTQKLKKADASILLELEPTPDILAQAAAQKGTRMVVGFALETENALENARSKLIRKHLDLIVLNNPLVPGAGFQTDTNQITLIDTIGRQEELPLMSKRAVAEKILDYILELAHANPAQS